MIFEDQSEKATADEVKQYLEQYFPKVLNSTFAKGSESMEVDWEGSQWNSNFQSKISQDCLNDIISKIGCGISKVNNKKGNFDVIKRAHKRVREADDEIVTEFRKRRKQN